MTKLKKEVHFVILAIILFSYGCQSTVKEDAQQLTVTNHGIKDTGATKTTPAVDSVLDNLSGYGTLVPLEIKDSSSNNVFEKFGIEFSGNCYACDLAVIRFNKKHIDFVNICDDKQFHRLEKYTYSADRKILTISTPGQQFTFTTIEDAPVYKLEINGKPFSLKGKRLATYYTSEKLLKKFKEHDCGDFEG